MKVNTDKNIFNCFACGTGGNIAALADRYRGIGVDTSERGIELARARFPRVENDPRPSLTPVGARASRPPPAPIFRGTLRRENV